MIKLNILFIMTKDKILVFGASDYTSYTIDVLEKQNEYEIFGISVEGKNMSEAQRLIEEDCERK